MWVSAKSDRRAGELGLVKKKNLMIFYYYFDLMLKKKIKKLF
jgi:hypothetical protein